MSDNKYYTPVIEEFHVGFEYERLYEEAWEESKYSITHENLYILNTKIDLNQVRVKYLDLKDIESLWDKTAESKDMLYGVKEIESAESIYLDYDPKTNLCRIHCLEETISLGIVKNKSKLEEIMKSIRVINETS